MRWVAKAALVGSTVFAWAAVPNAHHSFRMEFDATRPVRLTGTITRVAWVNPHAWIYLDVEGADGSTTNWAIECGPPGSLARHGWRPAMLPPGSRITVDAYPAQSGEPKANGRAITLPDGSWRLLESTDRPPTA